MEPRLRIIAAGNTAVRILLYIIQAGYVLFLVIAAFACLQMYRETRNLPSEDTEQTMIVLGCGLEGEQPSQMLWLRLTAAQTYLAQHPDIPVIVSVIIETAIQGNEKPQVISLTADLKLTDQDMS